MVHIPAKLNNLLNACTDEISAAVGLAVTSIQPFLVRNEAPFFPDYTDHGIEHVQSVLRSCELLISEVAWDEFTRQDAAVLILATFAHDLGMLLNIDGFRSLIKPEQNTYLIETHDLPWDKLWREFQLEVKRFDGATLLNLSGSPEPIDNNELNLNKLSERGIKIVGEFLRRHHHRIAHELVLLGMPSESGRVPLFDGVPEYLKNIAGIISRSHGESLRYCLELESLTKLDTVAYRQYRNIHPTFLMAIVRLADYLDLDISRAPKSILSAKALKSPISRREWWAQRTIIDCHSYDDDPECLRIIVECSTLKDVNIFSTIEGKIKGLQEELDSCWAVLGEVYGRVAPLNKLNLRIRRVRSNLRASNIVDQLPFVPHKISLESARADLLKLLIEPLYGDRPSIGIRELVQNAVDAIREFEFIVNKKPSLAGVKREKLPADVIISFEKDNKDSVWITVADRGVGMTWETVSKYYLTAGASFRKSDAWKKEFTDDTGKSKILRSGRFGIGVLSAFLLGDRIKVSTRHIEEQEDRGIQFEFGFEDINIELKWIKRDVGTTVSVRSNESTISRLHDYKALSTHRIFNREKWDWYCLDKPVLIRYDRNGKKIKSGKKIPGVHRPLPKNWHRIKSPKFQCIDWSYISMDCPLVCNGIKIPHASIVLENYRNKSMAPYYQYYELDLNSPFVSVFDPDGRLPLNLSREDLAGYRAGFESLLTDDVCRNFIAFCLIKGPFSGMFDKSFQIFCNAPQYPGYRYITSMGYFFYSRYGFGLMDPWNVSHFSSAKCLLIRIPVYIVNMPGDLTKYIMDKYDVIFTSKSDNSLSNFDYWHRRLLHHNYGECFQIFRNIKVLGFRIQMPNVWYDRLIKKQPKFLMNKTELEKKTDFETVLTVGDCPSVDTNFFNMVIEIESAGISYESITEIYFAPTNEYPKPTTRITQMWKEVIGNPIIPFDKIKRQKIINSLGNKFKRHLAQWTNEEN
jgi:molecular chaperone HtpG